MDQRETVPGVSGLGTVPVPFSAALQEVVPVHRQHPPTAEVGARVELSATLEGRGIGVKLPWAYLVVLWARLEENGWRLVRSAELCTFLTHVLSEWRVHRGHLDSIGRLS